MLSTDAGNGFYNWQADTLLRYFVLLFEVVESRVASELPESATGNTGTAGISAASEYYEDLECSSRRFLLLAFSPVETEKDLSAQSEYDLIADTLSRYNKPWNAVKFMVGDNCSVDQYIGRKEGAIPQIGCASHRFNLAVKDYLKKKDELITKVHAFMSKLRTVKGRAILRRVSHLSPLLRNGTRWSSTYETRYVKLQPLIV
ncbi:hypothetical protein JG687_00006281 [Phytophthora cactorum]|uniref:Uncharacterized protein n=1 Tax=Phytophthora cactorum TaxID=29920 RepID=A0A8T1UIR9_9STRA|nr:hypothetical protein JG687_00006281 [Phytophthora cactorum]